MANRIHCMSFGMYSRTLSVGFTDGIRVFSISNDANLELLYESCSGESTQYRDTHCVECIDTTVSLVQYRYPRHLIVYDFAKKREVNTIEFDGNIITFKINRRIILIRLLHSIHVVDAETHVPMKEFWNVGPDSLSMALCPITSPTYFAYPSVTSIYSVTVYSINKDSKFVFFSKMGIPERTPELIEFNPSGSLIAISADGIVIYVFTVETGQNIHQFCRGLTRSVVMTSLFFAEEKYLISSSDSETVHIFEMNSTPSWLTLPRSVIGNYLSRAISYLPFGDSLMMQRSSLGVKIPTYDFHTRTYCWRHLGILLLAVVSKCGQLHMFIVDVANRLSIRALINCNLLRVGKHHATVFPPNEGDEQVIPNY